MVSGAHAVWKPSSGVLPVRVYLLGTLRFEDVLAFQHRLADEVAMGGTPALVCCEHPALVTVGRSGSHAHMDLDPNNRTHRAWHVRWVNRGGGCWFHSPGQLAIYPILPLKRLELGVRGYVARLQAALVLTARELGIAPHAAGAEVFVGTRPIACVGASVCDWTTYFGAILNVNPDLLPHRLVRTGSKNLPMTSLQRECRRPFRPSHIRERFIEHFVAEFGLGDTLFFTGHPSLVRGAAAHALPAAR